MAGAGADNETTTAAAGATTTTVFSVIRTHGYNNETLGVFSSKDLATKFVVDYARHQRSFTHIRFHKITGAFWTSSGSNDGVVNVIIKENNIDVHEFPF